MSNILVTGCSMGIGFATALELARAGHRVWATMRNPGGAPRLGEVAAAEGLPIEIRTLDVDSDESGRACFAGIDAPIDVLVNNAGIEVHGSVEEMPIESVIAVMNTNYFGTVRCIQAVLPQMRERRSGCIINISSVAGRISNSPLGAYAASKFAVEAISEALAGEVKPFGQGRTSVPISFSRSTIVCPTPSPVPTPPRTSSATSSPASTPSPPATARPSSAGSTNPAMPPSASASGPRRPRPRQPAGNPPTPREGPKSD